MDHAVFMCLGCNSSDELEVFGDGRGAPPYSSKVKLIDAVDESISAAALYV